MKSHRRAIAVLLVLCVSIGALLCYSYPAITASNPNFSQFESLPVVIIDAGHGGFDGGAVGVDGIIEKDINLSIAQKLSDLLKIHGIQTVLTRDSDQTLDGLEENSLRERKRLDIQNRMALAKSYPNSVLLSIHQNQFQDPTVFGAQVFYGPENSESFPMAEILQRRMISMLQPENTRKCKECTDDVYLIYHAPMPALLIECGFLSNSSEAYQLIDSSYQKRIAFTIFSALMEYWGLEDTWSTEDDV